MSLGLGNILVQQRNSGGSVTTPNLQQVTDVGNNTTNDLRLDFVGFGSKGLYVYDLLSFSNKVFFGTDLPGNGKIEYYVTGAVNTAMGFNLGNNSQISSYYGGSNRMGLILDFTNLVYYLGDPDLQINGTYLRVDDNNQEIATGFYQPSTGAYPFGIFMNFNAVTIGDYQNNVNGTYIEINDVAQRLVVSPNLITTSAGSTVSQHLSIWVSGVHYKIQLKNP